MALSEQDKQRIREEELFRLQVREEHQRAQQAAIRGKTIMVFWIVIVAVAVLLFALVRSGIL